MSSSDGFVLHPRLVQDCLFVTDWQLSRVLLVDDRRFPWIVLVPRRAALAELHDLDAYDRPLLMEEIARASAAISRAFRPDKINVAALGNIVSQLHIHVVARTHDDPAWPGPVWGVGKPIPYGGNEQVIAVGRMRAALGS